MKKIIISLSALVIAFSMTACSQEGGEGEETVKTIELPPAQTTITDVGEPSVEVTTATVTGDIGITPDEDIPRAQKYVDMLNNRRVYFKCIVEDEVSKVITETAYDGKNMYMKTDYGEGVTTTMIANADGIFTIIPETKTYYPLSSDVSAETVKQVFTESTEEYDEYTGGGAIYRYFLDENGNLSSEIISPDGAKAHAKYMVFTDEIPEGLFEIPEGYIEEKAE